MPPAISDEEMSDFEINVPITTTKRSEKASAGRRKTVTRDDDEDDDEILGEVKGDVKGDEEEAEDDADDDDEEGAEDLDEDEFVVEKIISHVYANSQLKFKVKWEGWEEEADQTWEDEDNLRENASSILTEYLESIGGRDKIIEESKAGAKGRKRGRPASGTPTNGTKRAKRTDSHPASATPPRSAAKVWQPPAGSWENEVQSIDACQDDASGKLVVYLTWVNGQKTQHDTRSVYQRCPQKMLQFYERHVKVVGASKDGTSQ